MPKHSLIIATLVSTLILLIVVAPSSARLKITPTINFSEEYNDNIFLDPSTIAESDWLTTIEPGFSLLWETSNVEVDLDYSLRFVYFKDNSYLDETSFKDVQRGKLTSTLFPDEDFSIITEGEISRVVVDESNRTADENEFINRATRYNFSINPSYRLRLAATLSATLGYLYEQSTYNQIEHSESDDLFNPFDEPNDFRRHVVNLEFLKQIGAKTSLWAGYFFTDYQADENSPEEINEDFLRHDCILGIEQKIGSRLTLLARGGIAYFDFDETGTDSGSTWQAGLNYQPSERFIFEILYMYNYEPSISRGLSKIEDLTTFLRYHGRLTADLQLFTRKTTYTEGELDLAEDYTEDKSTGATLRLSYPLGKYLKINLNGDYAYWEFKPDNEEVDRYGLGTSIVYNLQHLDITLSHTYRVNNSNDNENDYRNNITLLKINYEF